MRKLTNIIKENADQLRVYSVGVTLHAKFVIRAMDDGDAGETADDKVDEIDAELSKILDGYELTNYQIDAIDETTEEASGIKESYEFGIAPDKQFAIGRFVRNKDDFYSIWKMQHDDTEFEIYNKGLDPSKAYLFVVKSGHAAPMDLNNLITPGK